MSYHELFEAGAELIGSYRCSLTIAAPKLELLAGGPPGSALSAAAGAAAVLRKLRFWYSPKAGFGFGLLPSYTCWCGRHRSYPYTGS